MGKTTPQQNLHICGISVIFFAFLVLQAGAENLPRQSLSNTLTIANETPQTRANQQNQNLDENLPRDPVATTPIDPAKIPTPLNGHDDYDKAKTDRWLIYVTAALAVVGFLQLIAMLRQESWMRKNVQATKRSADATSDIVTTLKDTAMRQLRAYVLPDLAQRVPLASGDFKIKVEIRNSGQTPAYDYVAFLGIGVFALGSAPVNLVPGSGVEFSKGDLAPGGKIELGGISAPLTPEQEDDVRNGKAAIYVHGEVTYRDAFAVQRFTKFRLFCTWEWLDSGRFAACPDGNETS